MSDWRATLARAAMLSSDAARRLPALIRLLESAAANRATADDVRNELGTVDDRRPGFIEALDAALRSGRREQPGLGAARAVLFELPALLDASVSDTDGGAAAILAQMHAREGSYPNASVNSTLVCPRCGSRRIQTQHTDAFERRIMEVRCAECGNTGGWTEGDADEAAWQSLVPLPMPTELTLRFIEYLRTGATQPRKLAAALRAAGLRLEGSFLEREGWQANGDWGRVFVGRQPPGDAAPGEVWLDIVEVMPMVLVEAPTYRDDRPRKLVWLAIRPVQRWQFRAFAATAPIVGRTVQVELPVKPLDPARLAGDELAPMASITEGEAELYGLWFGKVTGTRDAWRGAAHTLGDRAGKLWMPGFREWIGEHCSFDEGLRARIGPDDIELHPDDDYIAMRKHDAEPRVLVGEAAYETATGLRTVARAPLLTEIDDTFRPFMPITLDRVYPR